MTGETPDVELSSVELGDLAAAYGWWNAHGDPEAFYDVLDAAVQRILTAAEAAHARDHATLRERAEVAEAAVVRTNAVLNSYGIRIILTPAIAALADRPAGGEGR